jgi:hypothetical protein
VSARLKLKDILEFKATDLGYTNDYPGCCDYEPSKKRYPSLYVSDKDEAIDLPLSGMARVKYKLMGTTTRQDEEGKKKHSADIQIESIEPIEDEDPKEGVKPINYASKLKDLIELGLRDDIDMLKAVGLRRRAIQPGFKHIKSMHLVRDAVTKTDLALPKGSTVKDLLAQALKTREKFRSMSAREELGTILFNGVADPRPRNTLGMFSDAEQLGPNPEAMAITYKRQIPALESPLSKIAKKLKGVKL